MIDDASRHPQIVTRVTEGQEALGLGDWRIKVAKGDAGRKAGCDCSGNCTYDLAEKKALIVIDPQHIHDEASAMNTCFHEVAHLAPAPVDNYVDEMVHKLYPRNVAAREEAFASYDRVREELISRIVGKIMKRDPTPSSECAESRHLHFTPPAVILPRDYLLVV